MTHYEVLGVDRDATEVEIRRAYLRLSHEHHPDHHLGSDAATRSASEQRMRDINAAWRVLSDRTRRHDYDDTLDRSPTGAHVIDEPPRTWRPFDDGWDLDPDDLDPRLDDSQARRPTGGRVLALLPVSMLVVGLAALVVGGVSGLRPLLALAFACLALSMLLFVGAPIAIILESRRHDRL